MRSLRTARAESNLVQIRKKRPQVDSVDTRRIADTHEPSHEAEKASSHIGAAATEKDVNRLGAATQNLSDLHVTRYFLHRRLLAEWTTALESLL